MSEAARDLLIRDAEVDGEIVDLRVSGGRITAMGRCLDASPGARVVHAAGGAVLPGLHDHHLHLLATAAMARSVDLGPAAVRDRAGLADALRRADRELAPGEWLRGVAYHESVAGDLDRRSLDAWVAGRPIRIQHRSGARWTLNTAAVRVLGLEDLDRPGIEREASGEPTGRLHRADRWLRELFRDPEPADLAPLGRRLASYGVTGVTDATPFDDLADLATIARARAVGDLPQRVMVTGGPALTSARFPNGLERGPVKLVIDDAAYPSFDVLTGWIADAHAHDRNVAIHCVTRTALALAVAAWTDVGSRAGDRVEHASVAPPDLRDELAALRLSVVTQPAFVTERGDQYLDEVDSDDVAHLYPCRSLLDAGIAVAGSTDAPYSAPDPWRAISAATTRTTPSGSVVGPEQRISPTLALRLFLSDLDAPGGPTRTVGAGRPADLCLLDCSLERALADLDSAHVRMALCSGAVGFER